MGRECHRPSHPDEITTEQEPSFVRRLASPSQNPRVPRSQTDLHTPDLLLTWDYPWSRPPSESGGASTEYESVPTFSPGVPDRRQHPRLSRGKPSHPPSQGGPFSDRVETSDLRRQWEGPTSSTPGRAFERVGARVNRDLGGGGLDPEGGGEGSGRPGRRVRGGGGGTTR